MLRRFGTKAFAARRRDLPHADVSCALKFHCFRFEVAPEERICLKRKQTAWLFLSAS